MAFIWIDALDCWVGKYEVTNEEFRMKDPGHESRDYKSHDLNGDHQPVVYVNLGDAQKYVKWLTEREHKAGRLPGGWRYRLPTKDEWMTFAQCGDGRKFPWGENGRQSMEITTAKVAL